MGLMGAASLCAKLCLGIVLILALMAVHHLGYEWEQTIVDVEIYTIQDPRFWGPMTMLVPKNCTLLADMMATRDNTTELWELPTHFGEGEGPPTTVQTNLLGHPILPARDVVNLVAVQSCNHTFEAPEVTWMQYYWAAMITASSGFGIDQLHSSRMNFYWAFAVMAVLQYLTEFGVAGVQFAATQEAENQGREPPKMPLAIKIYQQASAKFSSIQMQLTFVSLFITLWHEDHYLMNYFPGMVYVLMVLMVPGSLCIPIVAEKAPFLMIPIAAFMCFILCFGAIPVAIGWNLYNLQFLWGLFWGEYSNEVAFSANFPSLQATVGHATKHLLGINLVDAALATADGVALREPEPGSDMIGLLATEPDEEMAAPFLDQ